MVLAYHVIDKISKLLSIYKGKKKISLRDLQWQLGLLNFASGVIIPGRVFLRRLFDLTIGHTSPHYRIRLNSEARYDLKLWHSFIESYNGKSCFLFQNWVSSKVLKIIYCWGPWWLCCCLWEQMVLWQMAFKYVRFAYYSERAISNCFDH